MARRRFLKQQDGQRYVLAASGAGTEYRRNESKYNIIVPRRMSEKEIIRELCRGWLFA